MLAERYQQLSQSLDNTPAGPVAKILAAILAGLDELLAGKAASWQSLVSAETAASFHEYLSSGVDNSSFFKVLGHSRPTLRVLELAGGAQTPSLAVLQSLTLPGGRHLWSQYTFASRSLVAPEDRLTSYPSLQYASLDMSDDLAQQDLESGTYDLVIANNVLHATPNATQSLRNIRALLAPGGCLMVKELPPASIWINAILGTAPAWWHPSDHGLEQGPCVGAEHWLARLEESGYSAPEVVLAGPAEGSQTTTIVAVARSLSTNSQTAKPVSLLVADKTKTYERVESILQEANYAITKITLKDTPPPNRDVVSILDLDGPFWENVADESYRDFQRFLAGLQESGVFWLTRPCHMGVPDPRYAPVVGLARVIRSELLVDFATCEVDEAATSLAGAFTALAKFLNRHHHRREAETLGPDFEYAVANGTVHVGRYFPFVMMSEFPDASPPPSPESLEERSKVAIRTPGQLNTLHWTREQETDEAGPPKLRDGEVEIEMHAVGVNFKDVLVSMNLLDHVGRYHGLEGAGVVRRVGAGVTEFQPGDRVAAQEHNMLSTLLVADATMCVRIPDSLSFIDAATLFTVYATAQQALLAVGRLRRGDSVLIHSACGGVGLAAVQIARMVGADIYATVGAEHKVQYLVENWDIPRHHIFGSRNNGFVEGLHRETGGRGVTIVLNSLSGELLHESWQCVAPHGKLIEIGKRDLIGHGRLDMAPFAANRSYCCVDINDFYDTDRPRYRELMTETLEYLERGLVTPLPIAKAFPASEVPEAFKHLLPGTHIGRVGVRIRDDEGRLTLQDAEVASPRRQLRLDPTGSYLLVGGLGGLGRAVATFLVQHGATRLVFLGRRAGETEGDGRFLAELASMGDHVRTIAVRGDVTQPDDVARAVAQAATLGPLRGILQMTAVQADENFARLTKAQWDYSLGPKVAGTWNLHRASVAAGAVLDIFLLFSSMSAVIGLPGQANYAAGNSFLDAFVQYRRGLGLACSAINIGPVADVGFLADRAALLKTATLTGFKTLQEEELLDAVELAMMPPPGQLDHNATTTSFSSFSEPGVFVLGLASTLPLESPANRAVWKTDRRMALYHNDDHEASKGTASSSNSDPLRGYIARARADPSLLRSPEAASYFAREIGARLFGLLLKDVSDLNTSLALTDLGLDSLVAIELRSWWKQTFEFDISVLEMLSMGDLEALGAHATGRLLQLIEDTKEE